MWTKRSKSLLIDSLLRGYPLPLIFLNNQLDLDRAVSIRQVVDGQQRIRTLLSFIDSSCLNDYGEDDEFTVLRSHNGQHYGRPFAELPPEIRTHLLETQLSVVVLPSGIPDVEILRIFQRLNSTGLNLNPQELRNAEYFGEFKDLSYNLAYSQHQRWLAWGLFKPQQIAQMMEVEFTSDVLGLLLEGVKARRKNTIDKLYRDYDTELSDAELLEQRFRQIFDGLDEVFGASQQPSSLKRFRTTGWLYSCVALLSNADQVDLNGARRRGATSSAAPAVSPDQIKHALQVADDLLRSGELDEEVAKTLRGATSDRSSRAQRIAFIRAQI